MWITINGKKVEAALSDTIYEAAYKAGIYIPALCAHPNIPNWQVLKNVEKVYRDRLIVSSGNDTKFEPCELCVIEIEGNPDIVFACTTLAQDGMNIRTITEPLQSYRRKALAKLLANHPHTCLSCAQREGCPREPCSLNIPFAERCCPKLGDCELQKTVEYIGLPEGLPRYIPRNIPILDKEPLIMRNYNLCIACGRCIRICETIGVGALAFTKNNGIVVGTKFETLLQSNCRFCGCCVAVCPTGALLDKNISWRPQPQQLLPCVHKCPIEFDVPYFTYLVATTRFKDASSLVYNIPFSRVLANACRHFCEDECRRREIDDAVAICSLKQFITAQLDEKIVSKPVRKPTGKKVAIVGGGPAGLSAAYYLGQGGHKIVVFDSNANAGGLMYSAIPVYRLPPVELEKDLAPLISHENIELRLNTKIGEELKLAALMEKFDAIFIATGAQKSKKIKLEGCDADGVLWGLDFLRDVKSKLINSLPGRVIVVGGGNVAIDVARTALRLGATVELVCLERFEEMPAYSWEIKDAQEEGVVIHNSWGPSRILCDSSNKVVGIELTKCISVFDENLKFNPKFDTTVKREMQAEYVVFAIGQESDTDFLKNTGVEVERNLIKVDGNFKASGKIFAGGEVVSGPKSIVEAIAAGRKAAVEIDKYLGYPGDVYTKHFAPAVWKQEKRETGARVTPHRLSLAVRKSTFQKVEGCYTVEEAIAEASRCLHCNLRLSLKEPLLPPLEWSLFNEENISKVEPTEGVLQIADDKKEIIYIAGVENLQKSLKEFQHERAKYFRVEFEKMYTKREAELLQQFLQKHGRLPLCNTIDDDLF